MLTVSAALMLGVLTAAPPAGAAQRFASASGSGTSCTEAAPCKLGPALNGADPGDEIIAAPGTYTPGATVLNQPAGTSLHGASATAKPVIVSSAANALVVGAGSTAADLRIEQTGGSGYALSAYPGVTLSGLEVYTDQAYACAGNGDFVITDSVCVSRKTSGGAVGLYVIDGGTNASATIRNVTAWGGNDPSQGLGIWVYANGANMSADIRNSIVVGGIGPDIVAYAGPGRTSSAVLSYSNFDSSYPNGTGASVTAAGTPTNQTAAPVFADEPGNDFHQAPASPTIDAGAADALTGPLDFEGQVRAQGGAVDIGADESEVAPDTRLTRVPKPVVKTRGSRATVRLAFRADEAGASFACKIDNGAFKPCSSPRSYRLPTGRHSFAVRAIDVEGTPDPTPARARFRIKRV